MGRIAEAFVDIVPNLNPLSSGLGKARAMLGSFAASAGRMGGSIAIGGLAGGAAIGAGLLAAAKKAADLGESLSKVRVTFGSAAEGMIDQSETLAARFGTVKRETLDAAAAFGLMGKAAKLSTTESAKLGQEFVQLGLDLASYHNISNQEAFEKLRSGLAGEAEPLRPLGIMLSEDAVKAEALAMGLMKVKRELTDQEKIIARVSLIKKQAGSAVGDLSRTEDSTANQMRKLSGELENAATDFGGKLEGALREGLKLGHELADVIRSATGGKTGEAIGDYFQRLAEMGGNVGRHVAGQFGVRLGPAPITPLTPAQVAQAQKDKEIAANNQLREGHFAQRARENDALNAKIADEKEFQRKQNQEDTPLGQLLQRGKLKIAGAMGINPEDVGGRLAGMAALLTPGGRAQAVNRLAAMAPEKPKKSPFQSEQFSGPAEFASFAIEKALGDSEAPPKKEQLDQANGLLKSINDGVVNLLVPLKAIPGMGAVMRGAP